MKTKLIKAFLEMYDEIDDIDEIEISDEEMENLLDNAATEWTDNLMFERYSIKGSYPEPAAYFDSKVLADDLTSIIIELHPEYSAMKSEIRSAAKKYSDKVLNRDDY